MPVCFCIDEEHRVLSFESVHYAVTDLQLQRVAPANAARDLHHARPPAHDFCARLNQCTVASEQSFRAAVRGELYAVHAAALCCTVDLKAELDNSCLSTCLKRVYMSRCCDVAEFMGACSRVIVVLPFSAMRPRPFLQRTGA